MEISLKSVVVNWFYTTSNGEEYQKFTTGVNGVKEIYYDKNDRCCYVWLESGKGCAYYNINQMELFTEKEIRK